MKRVELRVELTDEQAWQYAQFLKRVCLSDYEQRAINQVEVYQMLDAGERIREALREKGYAPR